MPRTSPVAPPARLVSEGGVKHLHVRGKRFVILGGELHNSSSSSRLAIRDAFDALDGMNLNTVLAPVSWRQLEPHEGEFDFFLVDELVSTARDKNLHLIPLWFGTWKNGRSTYIPDWVRSGPQRFPRAEIRTGETRDCLTPFATEAAEADARAFAALMAHIRDIDSAEGTIVMVQVENEVGILGDSRDRSAAAEHAYHSSVPEDVLAALRTDAPLRIREAWRSHGEQQAGTWSELFGDTTDTDEAFMAAAYARHVERVAAAGRAQYPLPLFANAWLYTQLEVADGNPAGGQEPGVYPSGGPLPHVGAMWSALAPSLDLLVPDIYFGDFDQICRDYIGLSGGLLIPEMRRNVAGVADAFVALGTHSAIGVSPFGIDTTELPEGEALFDAYGALAILAKVNSAPPIGSIRLHAELEQQELALGRYTAIARREPNRVGGFHEWGYGLIVQESEDTFLACGRGAELSFFCAEGRAEIVKVEELRAHESGVEVYRELNGDETESGSVVVLPSLEPRPPSDAYHIPSIRRRSGVVRFTLASPPPATAPAAEPSRSTRT